MLNQTESNDLWQNCLKYLSSKVSDNELNTWLKPLELQYQTGSVIAYILTPNKFIAKWVTDNYKQLIVKQLSLLSDGVIENITINVAGLNPVERNTSTSIYPNQHKDVMRESKKNNFDREKTFWGASVVEKNYLFENFIRGEANQIAYAASLEVAQRAKECGNPLLLYGASGLGKTHLMHAVYNQLSRENLNLIYVHSEKFFGGMVRAIQAGAGKIDSFKKFYRSADLLLVDDIHFFAGKDRTQQEFFHTFNALLDTGKQMIFTSDKYPKEINGLEERLQTRIGSGLSILIDPPELETRMAILVAKAKYSGYKLPEDVAFLIAQKIKSNVRELEGALKLVIANARLRNQDIDTFLVQESLKDLFASHEKFVGIEEIQKIVCEFYRIKRRDLLSKKRNKSIVIPRQVAMYLVKNLTNSSLPEIGSEFGGRDHTTVLHACRKIKAACEENSQIKKDYESLFNIITKLS